MAAPTLNFPYQHVRIDKLSETEYNTLDVTTWSGITVAATTITFTSPSVTIDPSKELARDARSCEPGRTWGDIDVTPVFSSKVIHEQGREDAEVVVNLFYTDDTKEIIDNPGNDNYLFYMERTGEGRGVKNSGAAMVCQVFGIPQPDGDEATGSALVFQVTLRNSSRHGLETF